MATLQITVPDSVKAAAESRAAEGGYESLDAYLVNLIDADRAVPLGAALEAEIKAGLATPARAMESADWAEIKRRFRDTRLPVKNK